MVLAGTSEGTVPVARCVGSEFTAQIMFAWSCETNYFVKSAQNSFEANKPVLNIVSASDPFFSRSNSWLGNPEASVILVPDAPHTLLNLPAARNATAGFLSQL